MRVVMKFGGTSLMDAGRVLAAARRICREADRGNQVVAVVSAQGHTTDRLLDRGKSVCDAPPPRELDLLLAAGEQMSAAIMAMAIGKLGREAVSLTAWQAGLRTDGVFGNARVLGLDPTRIQAEWDRGKIVVVAGFQGLGPQGELTTLGRGGSDTTAVALAAFLPAQDCRIYTDVDGVYDRDPRIYPEAKRFDRIGYDEMLDMARNGAQVLHSRCVELAKQHRVPIQVLSAFRHEGGTVVADTP